MPEAYSHFGSAQDGERFLYQLPFCRLLPDVVPSRYECSLCYYNVVAPRFIYDVVH